MGNLSLDCIKLMLYNPCDVEFHENGKIGWKTKEGELLIPAEYDQVEKCAEALYLRKGVSYEIYYNYGAERSFHNYYDGSFYVQDSKFGWRTNVRIIISPKYDYINSWGTHLFAVKKDGRYFYLNDNEEEVLTKVRHFENEDNDGFPFSLCQDDKNILTICEYVGREKKNDPNVVKLGCWVRLDRFSNEEIMKMLIDPEDESPLTDIDLMNYNSKFSYEYSAYIAYSRSKKGIEDCLQKIGKMGAYDQTWYYIIKVWKASSEEPTAEDLRYLRYFIESKHNLGRIRFALGHDSSLRRGETKMLMLTHYNEECFPPDFEFEWTVSLGKHSLAEIEKDVEVLRKEIEEIVFPEFKEEVWMNQFNGKIINMNYHKERPWEETEKVLNWLKQYDNHYENGIYCLTKDLFSYVEVNDIAKDEYNLHKLRWLLENGANPNAHRCNETAVDIIMARTSKKEKYKYNEDYVRRFLDLIIKYGAVSIEELMIEESKNDNYRIELLKMK